MTHRTIFKLFYSLIFTCSLIASTVHAEHSHQHIKVMGNDVYLIVMPAEMIRGHQKDHPESLMHRENRVENRSQFHISVGIIEVKSGVRLKNLDVSARIISENHKGLYKIMENMQMSGQPSFGNYFIIPGSGAYQVEVKIQYRNKSDMIIVTFDQAQV